MIKMSINNVDKMDECIVIENSVGWKKRDVSISITNEPKITGDQTQVNRANISFNKELEAAFNVTKQKRPNDFNGEKVSVKKIEISNGKIRILSRLTDYFTIWGFPLAAPELFQKSNNDFVKLMEIDTPCGLYAANIIVSADNKLIMNIISQQGGFNRGKISFGYEEQTEPEDISPIDTAVRGLKEEYGLVILSEKVRVLGFGKPFNMAFVSAYCVVIVDLISTDIIKARDKAIDKNESSCMLAVPFSDVDKLCLDEVPYELLEKYLISGFTDKKSFYVKHVANIPRWRLVKEYLKYCNRI